MQEALERERDHVNTLMQSYALLDDSSAEFLPRIPEEYTEPETKEQSAAQFVAQLFGTHPEGRELSRLFNLDLKLNALRVPKFI